MTGDQRGHAVQWSVRHDEVLADQAAWRLVGTGLGFVVFLGGGLALAVIAFPLIVLLTPDASRRRERYHGLTRWAFQAFIGMLSTLRVIDVGIEAEQEYIYIAHADGRDPSAKLRALAAWLKETFGSPPYWEAECADIIRGDPAPA